MRSWRSEKSIESIKSGLDGGHLFSLVLWLVEHKHTHDSRRDRPKSLEVGLSEHIHYAMQHGIREPVSSLKKTFRLFLVFSVKIETARRLRGDYIESFARLGSKASLVKAARVPLGPRRALLCGESRCCWFATVFDFGMSATRHGDPAGWSLFSIGRDLISIARDFISELRDVRVESKFGMVPRYMRHSL